MLSIDKRIDFGHMRLSASMQRNFVHEMNIVASTTFHLVLHLTKGLPSSPMTRLSQPHPEQQAYVPLHRILHCLSVRTDIVRKQEPQRSHRET